MYFCVNLSDVRKRRECNSKKVKIMKKQFFIVSTALIMMMAVIYSCSKDEPILVTGITITPAGVVSVEMYETITLSVNVTPTNATIQKVKWSSLTPAIATVDETTGVVTGVTVGSVTIRATATDNSRVFAEKNITVISLQENGFKHIGFVDERFELVSLVFRLAGREEYGDDDTSYQKSLTGYFESFKNHPAILVAKNLPLGYDAVFRFSQHLNDDFTIYDYESLCDDGRWTKQRADSFSDVLMDFYYETNFKSFFINNIALYIEASSGFEKNTWNNIDFNWFSKYVDTSKLQARYSLSSSRHNYATMLTDGTVIALCQGGGGAIIHEFCHSFGNPLAYQWYQERSDFRAICDNSSDPNQQPQYTTGLIMSGEYITRSYTILYEYDHGRRAGLFDYDKHYAGFPYIIEVFKMLVVYENRDINVDELAVLQVDIIFTEVPKGAVKVGEADFNGKHFVAYEYSFPGFKEEDFVRSNIVGNVPQYNYKSDTTYIIFIDGKGELVIGGVTYQGRAGYYGYLKRK